MTLLDKSKYKTFAGTAEAPNLADEAYVTVLFGYGKVPLDKKWYVDGYECIGGVIKNVPRVIAEHWAKGTRPDGKPAVGRIFIQAILPKNASEADYIAATGQNAISAEKLAAYINSTEAKKIIEALGAEEATNLVMQISKELKKPGV